MREINDHELEAIAGAGGDDDVGEGFFAPKQGLPVRAEAAPPDTVEDPPPGGNGTPLGDANGYQDVAPS